MAGSNIPSDAKVMPADTRKRCLALRIRSKKGEYLSPEDVKFLTTCWEQWPEEYAAMGKEVFKDSAPVGSRI